MGDSVKADEPVAMIETDKVTIPVNSPRDGKLVTQHAQVGDTVTVGGDLFTLQMDPDSSASESGPDEKIKPLIGRSYSTLRDPNAAPDEKSGSSEAGGKSSINQPITTKSKTKSCRYQLDLKFTSKDFISNA